MRDLLQWLYLQMERLRRLWRSSPLAAFFAWWGGELGQILPRRYFSWFSDGTIWYLLQHADAHWLLRCQGTDTPLARWSDSLDATAQRAALSEATADIASKDLRLALCLEGDITLRRRLPLPLAARDNLRQIGAFEMDRQTPFRAEQVYYDIREVGEQSASGRFEAELVLVPRTLLDTQLHRLRDAGIAIDAVDLTDGTGRLGMNLLPDTQLRVRRNLRRRLNWVLVASVVFLLMLCLEQWLHNRRLVLQSMQSQVNGMQARVRHVALLRRKLRSSLNEADFLTRRKTQTVSVLEILNDLTKRMPGDTWLERFSLDKDGRLDFQGQSPKAVGLIETLQNSKFIDHVAFEGAIQRVPSTGKERFYMSARLRLPVTGQKPVAHNKTGAAEVKKAGVTP